MRKCSLALSFADVKGNARLRIAEKVDVKPKVLGYLRWNSFAFV
jgi:hypothetical protein